MAPNLSPSHEEASGTFQFRTVETSEHVVTVEVTAEDTKAPLKDADILLHPYRARTGDNGVAELRAPKGRYELYVTKHEYKIFQTTVEVASDVAVKVGLAVVPQDWNELG